MVKNLNSRNTRNPIYIVIAIVVVIVAVGLAFLFLVTSSDAPPAAAPQGSAEPSPSATSGTPTAAPDPKAVTSSEKSTSLNVAVTNCENCQITAQPTEGSTDLQPLSATVADGVAQIDVPTSTTLGMVFSVRGEKDGVDLSNDKLVILAVEGKKSGAAQSEGDLTKASSGQYCWAGTTLDVATIQFAVSGSGDSPKAAWADPALATTKQGSVDLKDGTAGIPGKLTCGN